MSRNWCSCLIDVQTKFVCITAPGKMVLENAMISGPMRCYAVKNKYMKRIKNQFRTDQLQSTKSTLMGIIAAGE